MGFFADTIHKFAPSWFQRTNMTKLLRAVGGELDAFSQRVFDGRRDANPYAAGARAADGTLLECDADVLPFHSRDRGIRLYATEPEASKRARLSQWRQLKKRRGSHQGELRNVQPYFLSSAAIPRMRIVHQSNQPEIPFVSSPTATWHTLEADGTYSVHRANPSNWNWDGVASKKMRFWLIIYVDELGFTQPAWDGGQDWDGGSVWDGLFTKAQIDDFVAMVNEAKAAHSELFGLIFATDPASFDPTASATTDPDGWTSLPVGNWAYVIDNDTGKPTRLPSAVFAYDRGP